MKNNIQRALGRLEGARIVIVFDTLELGGSERQGLLLARFLKGECGAAVKIAGLRASRGRVSEICEAEGIPWVGIRVDRSGSPYRFHRGDFMRVVRGLRSEKPHVLLPYTFFPNVICGLAWRLSGAKLCVWNQRDEGIGLRGTFMEHLAVRLTPLFISNSENGKRVLVSLHGIDPARVAVIPNAVPRPEPVHSRSYWRRKLELGDDDFVSCMVANVHRNKDHETLLRAWGQFLDKIGRPGNPPVLLLAGRLDEGAEELRVLSSSVGAGDSIRFLGKVDDVWGLLRASDLFVFSSKSEGCPNAVLEAMAVGLPIVGTDIPGIREAVGPEGERFLARSGDAGSLMERIHEFFRDPVLRTDVGLALRNRIRNQFDRGPTHLLVARLLAERIGP